jgi:hypothetical protein
MKAYLSLSMRLNARIKNNAQIITQTVTNIEKYNTMSLPSISYLFNKNNDAKQSRSPKANKNTMKFISSQKQILGN